MGVRIDNIEVEDTKMGNFSLAMQLRHRSTNYRWIQITVYGPENHDLSSIFLGELKVLNTWEPSLPKVFGGDFNLIRCLQDKSSENWDLKLMDMFNCFIDYCDLKEIKRSDSKFTWTNKQDSPIMVNLDRGLVSIPWKLKFPLSHTWSVTRVGSDHNLIMFDSGEDTPQRQKYFTFEQQWVLEDDFRELCVVTWDKCNKSIPGSTYSLDRWHNCIINMRQAMNGWDRRKKGE